MGLCKGVGLDDHGATEKKSQETTAKPVHDSMRCLRLVKQTHLVSARATIPLGSSSIELEGSLSVW